MAPDFDTAVDVVKHSIARITSRFSPGDLQESTVLNTVDIDDDQHLTELKLDTFKSVQDGDQAAWNFQQFMVLQSYAISSTISDAANDIVDAAGVARKPKG
jgi:hypothetical protein